MTSKFWVTYRVQDRLPMRTGFISSLEGAVNTALDLEKISHVHEVEIERIEKVEGWNR